MRLKIATVQLPAREFGLEKIEAYLRRVDRDSVDIICFPEGYLNGYTRDEATARRVAIDTSSRSFQAALARLRKFKAMAIIGAIEIENDVMFNAAVVVQGGSLVGKYRKTHPQEGIFTAGSEYPVFTLKGVKFGINICYDANFPDASQELAAQGAKVIFYPLNNELKKESAEKWRHKHIENLVMRAKETNGWVVSSDVIIESDETTGYGCVAIVDPSGEVVGKMPELRQGILVHEVEV